jgi:hypothetical protein
MAQAPDQSLPQQNKEWSELQGAYRFLNNPKTTPPSDSIHSSRASP